MDHNPYLAAPEAGEKGSEAGIERPEAVVNIPWQTRAAPPSADERALADALQAIFADRVYDIPGVVARLVSSGVPAPHGEPWTEASFRAALARLGR